MEYSEYIKQNKEIIAMIHVQALPGTPKNNMSSLEIINQALNEAALYKSCGIKTVIIENMHDTPYTKNIGPEITSIMSVIGYKIKESGLYCGIQILAAGNKESLAVGKAAGLDFIRAEGFVYAHIGDEGMHESCAGELLRYRKQIGAEKIKIYTDIKKKHSSHTITQDVSVLETAKSAEFFLSDGIIITGKSTGDEPNIEDLICLEGIKTKKIIGSGITLGNLKKYYPFADIFIVGSYLKKNGDWKNEPDKKRVKKMIEEFNRLKNSK